IPPNNFKIIALCSFYNRIIDYTKRRTEIRDVIAGTILDKQRGFTKFVFNFVLFEKGKKIAVAIRMIANFMTLVMHSFQYFLILFYLLSDAKKCRFCIVLFQNIQNF